jgi:hypothetical protein
MGTDLGRRSRRIDVAQIPALVFFLITVVGCSLSGVTGWLGLKWGDDVASAGKRLSMKCDRWDPWMAGQPFDECIDFDHPVTALGAQALPILIRKSNKLEGLQLLYRNCGGDVAMSLRDKVVHEFKLEVSARDTAYQIFKDGSLVHLGSNKVDNTCTLTLTSPTFGKAFADALLKSGLGGLVGSFPPK